MTRLLHCLAVWMLVLGAQSVEAVIAFRAAASAGSRTSTIAFRATGSVANAASGSITPTLASSERNALLVCVVEQHDNVVIAFPAGWVQLYSISTTTTHRASVFYKVAGNTETDPTISHTAGNAIIAQCSTFRGVDAVNPLDVASAAQYAASSTSVASASLTTVTANDWMLYAMHVANNPSVTVAPSGTGGVTWTSRFYSSTASALRAAVGLYTGTKATAGSVGPISATVSSASENSGVLMALHNGSRLSIPVPAGTVAGDVMVAAVTVTASSVPITAPVGWTAIASTTQSGSTTSKLSTFYRVATASEPASYAWTLSTSHTGAAGGISSFSGVSTTNPIHVSGAQNSASSSTSQVAPSLTTTVANGMLVTAHEMASSPYSTAPLFLGAWQPPTGMTEAVDERSRATSSGSGIALEMNYLSLGAVGATGAQSATAAGSADRGASVAIVLKPTSGLDHLQIDFPQDTLSSCTSTPVTVTACASSGTTCTSLYTGGVSGIALTPGGDTISIPAGSGAVSASVAQAAGAGILHATSAAPSAATCKNLTTGAFGCDVTFSATALSISIPNFVAGKAVTANATACTVPDGANTVDFYTGYTDPSTGTKQVQIAPSSAGVCGVYTNISTTSAAPTALSLTFASNVTSLCLTYPDAGKVKLVSAVGTASTSAFFTAVPDHFLLSGINCVSGCTVTANPAAADATGAAFMKAGAPFNMTVTAYNGASPPAITPNFGKEASPEQVMLTPSAAMSDLAGAVAGNLACSAPSATCSNGSGGVAVMGGFGATTAGVASNAFTYDEVGIMTVTPRLYDPDGLGYLTLGNATLDPIGTTSGKVGRFIPDHFSITSDDLNPILTQSDFLPQITATATATTSPATVIGVNATTGFAVGAKVRIPGAGAAGAAFTATITALTTTTLTVNTAIGTNLVGGETVVQEWGSYMGEPFTAQFTLSAQNLSGGVAQNYQGAYAKLNPAATGNPLGFAAVNGATVLALDTSTTATGVFGTAGASISAPLLITRGSSPVGPYTAVKIGIAPADSDGVTMGGDSIYDLSVSGSVNHTSIMDPLVQAQTEFRFGRTKIFNAYGSELLALQVPVAIQYWNGSNYVSLTEDTLITLTAGNMVLSAYTGNLSIGATTITAPVLVNGAGKIGLSRPGVGKSGSVSLSISAPAYLPSNTARATFGIYRSPLLYRRENY